MQQKLFDFLRQHRGTLVSLEQITAATGYKDQSIGAYFSKFDLARFLERQAGGKTYFVVDTPNLNEEGLRVALTQSNAIRQVGWKCRNPLAKALVGKSRDNMILALELYNRPSLENRLDAFSMLFCTAWEQLLKAEIIESHGEEEVFRKQKQGRRRESISLDNAAKRCIPDEKDPVRQNIERIAELRHGATHLLMPEVQGVMSRLFQAGILNFARRFSSIAGMPLLPVEASGLLSVVGDLSAPNGVSLRQLYGKQTGKEIDSLIKELGETIESTNDEKFAVSVEYKLTLSKSPRKGDIHLTTSADADERGVIVIKPMLVENTHPYRTMDVVKRLKERCKARITEFDFQAMLLKERWKEGNNEYHHHQMALRTHWYSDKCVDELAKRILGDANYLQEARVRYSEAQSAKRAKKKAG